MKSLRQVEFDTSFEQNGMQLRGHVVAREGKLLIRVISPFRCCITRRSSSLSIRPTSDCDFKSLAEDTIRDAYGRRTARAEMRYSKSLEEWRRVAEDAHREIRSLNVRIRLMHDIMVGTAKRELQSGRMLQREYVQIRRDFRSQIARERAELHRLVCEQSQARRFASEISEIRREDEGLPPPLGDAR